MTEISIHYPPMTEISIHPFVGGFLINLTWVNGFKTSHDSSESELYASGIPKNLLFGVRIAQIGSRIVNL